MALSFAQLRKRASRTRPYLYTPKKVFSFNLYALRQMTSSSQIITEYGKQNIFARETPPQLVENYTSYPKEA